MAGRVVDANNSAVSGATVWAGRKYSGDRKQTTSDSGGKFLFHAVSAGDVLFAVMAKSQGVDSKNVNVQAGMKEIVFQLKGGAVIRAHVQDESGQPVANARVGLEGSYGEPTYDAYEFTANTDKDGNFSWDSAPNETLTFYIFHDGFESKRDAKLAPNQDNTVTLHKSRTLQGVVLDETTEQPVTKFTVRTGKANDPDNSNLSGIMDYKDFTAPDGKFSLALSEESDNAVAVYADGYNDKIERFPDAQNGVVQVVVKMKPSSGASGIVLAPDGSPAPGVTIAAVAEDAHGGDNIQLTGGRLHSWGAHNKIAVTDADGHFKLASTPDSGELVAAGAPGFARGPIAIFPSGGTITLLAWGRIEGTLKIGGQPGVGKDLLFNLTIPGIYTDFNSFKATTDEQGKFTMEKVPPGDGAIVRLIKTSPQSWTHSDSTDVTVKAGDTTPVALGDHGAVVVGKIRFEVSPTNEAPLNIEGNLSGQWENTTPTFTSPAEAQAYYKTPEYLAEMKRHKNYSVEMKPDGTFTVDDVAPGIYSVNFTARKGGDRPWEHPPIAEGATQITVPDSFNPAAPINVGEVLLKPNSVP